MNYIEMRYLSRRYFEPNVITNTRVIRIYPTEWTGGDSPCLITELIGCEFLSEFLPDVDIYQIKLGTHIVVCPAEGHERSRRSAGNTKKHKTCSQQKGTRIKRF